VSAIKGGYNSIVRQAQKLQSRLTKLQEELGQRTVEAQVGGGQVKITVNGDRKVVGLVINPEILDREDPQPLTEMLIAGFNEAMKNIQDMIDTETTKLTGGVNMPWML
jgi:DNA-binding YbaB/EbfC family protein